MVKYLVKGKIKLSDENYKIGQWEFDSYGCDGRSYVELSSTERGSSLEVFIDGGKELSIDADRDQWGVWLTFRMRNEGFTIGQEDDTKSFIDSLISGLTKIKEFTELGIPPTYIPLREEESTGLL